MKKGGRGGGELKRPHGGREVCFQQGGVKRGNGGRARLAMNQAQRDIPDSEAQGGGSGGKQTPGSDARVQHCLAI